MKKLVTTVFVLICASSLTLAQTGSIKGRVIDAKTFKPLPFATVYMNQTTIGTVTNNEGDFDIQNVPVGRYDLVVSYVGYQPYQSRVAINDSIPVTMSIKMVLSTTNLDEVLIRAKKDDKWNSLYDKFRRQFFGVSPYTAECKILNPWVLDFTEDATGILSAKASLPIEIENLGLGYNITCTLKEFMAGPNLYKISGTYRFVEAATLDTTLSSLWHSRREEVYRGSPRHLFKAILDRRVTEEGFDLYTDISNNLEVVRNSSFISNLNVSLQGLPPNELVEGERGQGQYVIKLPTRIEVHYLRRSEQAKIYRNIPHPISWIEVSGGAVEVNSSGVVMNPNRMTVLGAMSEPRIAEVLPLNYQPGASFGDPTQTNTKKSYSTLAALLEKPYLVTDKPYYYPSDAILFKAFFNYISPAYHDSLSHVMHVELIDSSNKIIQSKLFAVLAGTSYGDLSLPMNIKTGDYTLRAYTRWMLNFDKKIIFSKPIKVLPLNQLGKINNAATETKQLNILTEKDEFETREKITLALEAFNFYSNAIPADLVVSVTDLEQAVPPSNEKNILTQYQFTKDMLPDTSLKTAQYLIQYGIDFKGQMVTGKKSKPVNGTLTVYQDNVNDVFGIATDATGKFHQQLQLMDSVDLLVAAKTIKGRAAKVIMDEIKDPIPAIDHTSPLQLEVYTPNDASKYHQVDLFSTAKMLETVTIEAKRIERISADKKHLMSDAHLDGEFLRSTNATDLLSALRGRVPGLQIIYGRHNETGDVKKMICFPGITSRTVIAECLVEIDGIVLTTIGDETVAERLSLMSINDIESIDVLRFASASSYGARAANGVISIKTRLGNTQPGQQPRPDRSKLQVISLAGYSEPAEFTSPDYSALTSGDDRSDVRSTIYWNPLVVTNGKEPYMVSFYAADIPTRYRIVVEGVTADGEPVRGEKIIVVTSKK